MRRDYFLIGLGTRILMMALFVLINQDSQYNDASEIIYYAFQEMFKGNNPYSKIDYILNWGDSTFTQPFNYGPVTLILYLPAMLLPLWHNSLWLGMTVMINIYCYLIAEFLSKKGSLDVNWQIGAKINTSEKDSRQNVLLYYGGVFFWMIPVGTTCITVFIYGSIFLLVLALLNLNTPLLSGLFISLGAFSYQIIILMVPIFAIYYLRKEWKLLWKFIIGALPGLMIFLFFEIWDSGGIFYSLIGYNAEMPYNKCPTCANGFDQWSIFSIPRVLYNISNGNITIGPLLRIIFGCILILICIYFLIAKNQKTHPAFFVVKYCVWVIIGFTLTTNYGQSHYLIFLYPLLLFYYQAKSPDFRKKSPIGSSIYTWEDFEKYKTVFGDPPL
jgi:hypothetical protein